MAEAIDQAPSGGPTLCLSDFDYALPDDRIAQSPVTPRDSSRLLVVPRNGGPMTHRFFRDLPDYLQRGDVLVVNETRVTAVRLRGNRITGAAVEALLLRPAVERGPDTFEALVRPGKRLHHGERILFDAAGLVAMVEDPTAAGGRYLRFSVADGAASQDVTSLLEAHGRVPLPPYISAPLKDPERYQTIYARTSGSAAAPTAGLHFTDALLDAIRAMGVGIVPVRLDVGLGTFRPIRTENVLKHEMHAEEFSISADSAARINNATGRVIAVGTTSLRALETAAQRAPAGRRVAAVSSAETRLFVYPGFRFAAVDALITNFHQPHSTLLLLVAAFAGADQMRRAYHTALVERYRFLSFGDAMFVS
jgi:S-adenosylmethionine:tRNA ribosyltransferase-isomerase